MMNQNPYERLEALGLNLPKAAAPVASYVPFSIAGNLISVSGQIPFKDGSVDWACGRVGEAFDVVKAQEVARQCGLNLLAHLEVATEGHLERVACVKLGVFVHAVPGFKDHAQVANGVSDLMVDVLGEQGKHSRAAVGVASLPFGVAVEVDGLFSFIEDPS